MSADDLIHRLEESYAQAQAEFAFMRSNSRRVEELNQQIATAVTTGRRFELGALCAEAKTAWTAASDRPRRLIARFTRLQDELAAEIESQTARMSEENH